METLIKKIIPKFTSNEEINKWVKSLDADTKSFIFKSAKVMKQLGYLKWGVSTKGKTLSEIKNIINKK